MDSIIQKAAALEAEQKFGEAACIVLCLVNKCQGQLDSLVPLLGSVITLVSKITDPSEWERCKAVEPTLPHDHRLWEQVLTFMLDRGLFDGACIITVGPCGNPFVPPTYFHCRAANFPGLKLDYADVPHVMRVLLSRAQAINSDFMNLDQCHLKMCEFLIQHGGKLTPSADESDMPILVVATQLALDADYPSFLDTILSNICPSRYDDACQDSGDTAFHFLVKHYITFGSQGIECAKKLLANGCVSQILNKEGMMAHDCLSGCEPLRKILRKQKLDGVRSRIVKLKELGNQAMAQEQFGGAMRLYTAALSVIEYFPSLRPQAAILFSNCSAVLLKGGHHQEALAAAVKSRCSDENFLKAYYREGRAHLKLKQPVEAFKAFLGGCRKEDKEQTVTLLTECLAILPDVCKTKSLTSLAETRQFVNQTKEHWPALLNHMIQNKLWATLSILVLGPPYWKNKELIVDYDASTAKLHPIFESMSEEGLEAARLVVALLKHRADFRSLCDKPDKEKPLHAALRFCLRTDDPQVMSIAITQSSSQEVKAAIDAEGRTPLHTLCLEVQKQTVKETHQAVMRHLLDGGVDGKVKDKYGRTAQDYLNRSTPLWTILQDWLKKQAPPVFSENSRHHQRAPPKPGGSKPKPSSGSEKVAGWKSLKDKGNAAYKQGNIFDALNKYTDAIEQLEMCLGLDTNTDLILQNSDSHELAVLYGNRAECWAKSGEKAQFLEDAKANVEFDGNWFKGHLRVARAFRDLGKRKGSIAAFTIAFERCRKCGEADSITVSVLKEFVDFVFPLGDKAQHLAGLNDTTPDLWAQLAYQYIKEKAMDKAELTFYKVIQGGPGNLKLDLSVFCRNDAIVDKKWVPTLLLYYALSGCDMRTLQCEGFGPYLHATVMIVLQSGCHPFVAYNRTKQDSEAYKLVKLVMEREVKVRREENMVDNKGWTVLHLLAQVKLNETMRICLVQYMVESGVDPTQENNEKKSPYQLAQQSETVYVVLHDAYKTEKTNQRKLESMTRAPQQQQQQQQRQQQQQSTKPQTSQQGARGKQPTTRGNGRNTDVNGSSVNPPRCQECERNLSQSDDNRSQNKLNEAYRHLVAVINKTNHQSDPRHGRFRQTAVDKIVSLLSSSVTLDIPKELIKIHHTGCRDVLKGLARDKRWRQMEALVSKVKGHQDQALKQFARDLSLSDLASDPSLRCSHVARLELLDLWTGYGATLDLPKAKDALAKVMEYEEFKVALRLLEMGADPHGMTLTPGDTPNHAALMVALDKDKGNFKLLDKLRQLYQSDPRTYSYLDVCCEDDQGNTLLHLAAQAKFSPHSLRAVELLSDQGAPLAVPNFAGQLPKDCLVRQQDRRLPFLQVKVASSRKVATPSESQAGSRLEEQGTQDGSDSKDVKAQSKASSKPQPSTLRSSQFSRTHAEEILNSFPQKEYNFLMEDSEEEEDEEEEEEEETSEEEEEESEEEEDLMNAKQAGSSSEDNDVEEDDDDGDNDASVSDDEDEEKSSGTEVDIRAFDNLTWDVECTEDVWNLLRSRKGEGERKSDEDGQKKKMKKERIPPELKQIVVKRIQKLASGEWRPNMLRRVKRGVPSDLQLYRITLPGGACIFWELAIAFSPRLSDTADSILNQQDMEDQQSALQGGRIYSELIRVWNIVLRFNDRTHAVRRIISSFKRGEKCIEKKDLTGFSRQKSQFSGATVLCRVPMLFAEKDNSKLVKMSSEGTERCLFPPASPGKNEFHILKFYSFSSSLVSAILSASDTKIDFPFRVTATEDALINLKTEAPILLLGRSGTGKTTCCLYRLWSRYLKYWERALEAEAPLVPRETLCLPDIEEEDEQEEEKEEESKEPKKKDKNKKESKKNTTASTQNGASAAAVSDPFDDIDEGEDIIDDDEDEEDDDDGAQYDHLHQLFVTKNPVLCREVDKNFVKLQQASKAKTMVRPARHLPNRLQDVEELSFPLFLTSRRMLLMLDASVEGQPFFPRDEDLDLRHPVPGWGDNPRAGPDFLLDNSDDEEENVLRADNPILEAPRRADARVDPRREVTYDIFAYRIWPKIAKKMQSKCHPSLVWTEINSFIKGSYNALLSPEGYLTCQQYLELGRKRAPNFTGDREQVYEIFLRYVNYKRQNNFFDEPDVVFRIYHRLKNMRYHPWIIHEIYVDETQDFTQAELALLVSLARSPNDMFLTGDTAQAIMRGISFRFEDLLSLFYFAREKASQDQKYLGKVNVPKKVYKLCHNYRSHMGILELATSVLDILTELFQESLDILEPDQGMFHGPQPVLIQACSTADLAVLLSGNSRRSSHIEFGAHQAILVASEEVKQGLPDDLKAGIVLTIYEAKGLEFDDILLYNFFTDSQADKEWRVVTNYLESLVRDGKGDNNHHGNLVEIDAEILKQPGRPRPLTFDPNQHKVLNSELKQLYTALTRARVNVWIFDHDETKRAPMFEYFTARCLVRCLAVAPDGEHNTDNQEFFSEKSSSRDWKIRGDKFMSQKLYTAAAKCYRHSGHRDKAKLAEAYQAAQDVSRMQGSGQEIRDGCLRVGVKFLECGDLARAARYFQSAKEYKLAALAYNRQGQLESAAVMYSRLGLGREASHLLEQLGHYGRAIQVLVDAGLHDHAIDCRRRYQMCVKKLQSEKKPLPDVLLENPPRDDQSDENLCYNCAKEHWKRGERQRAIDAIMRSQNPEDQIKFFKQRGLSKEAANILQQEGKSQEAVQLYLDCGDPDNALTTAQEHFLKADRAHVHLILAARALWQDKDLDLARQHARWSHDAYTELVTRDRSCRPNLARSNLLLASLDKDLSRLKEALKDYKYENQQGGQLECYRTLLELKNKVASLEDCTQGIEAIHVGFEVITHLQDSSKHRALMDFYQLQVSLDGDQVNLQPSRWPQCWPHVKHLVTSKSRQGQLVSLDKKKVVSALVKGILRYIVQWQTLTHDYLQEALTTLSSTDPCPFQQELKVLAASMRLDFRLQTGMEAISPGCDKEKEVQALNSACTDPWRSCHLFLDLVLPPVLPPSRRTEKDVGSFVQTLRQNKICLAQLKRYMEHLWANQGRVGRGKSEDLTKERCKSTRWLLSAVLLNGLLRLGMDVMGEVSKLEKELLTKRPRWLDKIGKYALWKSRDGPGLETIGGCLVTAFLALTDPKMMAMYGPLLEVYVAFGRVVSAFHNRSNVSLLPNLDHLVLMMEVFFALSLFLMARTSSSKTHFYLTGSQLASVHLLNTCSQGESIQTQVVNCLKGESPKLLMKWQDPLLNLLLGHSQYGCLGLMGLVPLLWSGDPRVCRQGQPNPGLAHRIISLALVVLINIPTSLVRKHIEGALRREFFKLKFESVPPVTRELLDGINQASGYQDVVRVTMQYLQQFSDDHVNSCVWQGRVSCPLTWNVLDRYPGNSTWYFYDNIEEKALETWNVDIFKTDSLQEEEIDKGDEEKMDQRVVQRQQELKQEELRKTSGQVILKLFRRLVMIRRLEKKSYRNYEVEEMFMDYRLSKWACGVCGIEFKNPMDLVNIESETASENQANHRERLNHLDKKMELESFKKMYGEEIYEKNKEISDFLTTHEVTRDSLVFENIERNVSDILGAHDHFLSLRNDIMARQAWDQGSRVREAFEKLLHEYTLSQAMIRNKAKEHAAAQRHQERMNEDFIDDPIDHLTPYEVSSAQQDMSNPLQQGARKRSHQQRKREKKRRAAQQQED